MSWITWILAVLGFAQSSPEVRDVEGKAASAGLALIKGIFDWIEEKVVAHPMLLASFNFIEGVVLAHGADALVAFLKARGIEITITKPPQDPPTPAV